MDRTAYEGRWKNLHSWAGHLWSTIEEAIPQASVELGPPGDETIQDVRNAATTLQAVAASLDDLMGAYDLLLESVGRPRRYDDFLQRIEDQSEDPADRADDDDAVSPEINRARLARLASELYYDAGWLQGAIHGAMICHDEERIDAHLDGIATGIEELMISYDRIQDVIGAMPARHCAFFDHMVVLEEKRRPRVRSRS